MPKRKLEERDSVRPESSDRKAVQPPESPGVEALRQQASVPGARMDDILDEVIRNRLRSFLPDERVAALSPGGNDPQNPLLGLFKYIHTVDAVDNKCSEPGATPQSMAELVRTSIHWPVVAAIPGVRVFWHMYFHEFNEGCTRAAVGFLNLLMADLTTEMPNAALD